MTSRVAHRITDGQTRTRDVVNEDNANIDFASLLLTPEVQAGLASAGFERPSPIQLKAIPLGRCGLDLIVQAKSGTGKTCVFSVIALEGLDLQSSSTQVLILAPTREIAMQIQEVVRSIGSAMKGLCCYSFIGGTMVGPDRQKLKKCHIAVGSPGRIKQLIEFELLKTESIRLFVLDEADKLLDHKFREQVNWIYHHLTENKQMLAVSATYPEYLATQLTTYMRDPTFVRLNRKDLALHGIQQYFKVVQGHQLTNKAFEVKVEHLVEILSQVAFNQCLVFSNLQTRAQNLSDMLNVMGWPSTYISGHQEQTHRLSAMAMLKKFQCRILISTDLTARGIDAENVNLIVNLDVPFDIKTYLHRIGRAGRFGTQGAAITLASTGQEEMLLANIKKHSHGKMTTLPDPLPPDLLTNIQASEDLSNSASSESDSDTGSDHNESGSVALDMHLNTTEDDQSKPEMDNVNHKVSADVNEVATNTQTLHSENKYFSSMTGSGPELNVTKQAKKVPKCVMINQSPGTDKGCQVKPNILSGIMGIDTFDCKIPQLSKYRTPRTVSESWTYEKANKDLEMFLDLSKAPPREKLSEEIELPETSPSKDDEPHDMLSENCQESAQKGHLQPQMSENKPEESGTETSLVRQKVAKVAPLSDINKQNERGTTQNHLQQKQVTLTSLQDNMTINTINCKTDHLQQNYGFTETIEQKQDVVGTTLSSKAAAIKIQPGHAGQHLTSDENTFSNTTTVATTTTKNITDEKLNMHGTQSHHKKAIINKPIPQFSIGPTLHQIKKAPISTDSGTLESVKNPSGKKDLVWEAYRQYVSKSNVPDTLPTDSISSSSNETSDTESSGSHNDSSSETQDSSSCSSTDSESHSETKTEYEDSELESDEERVLYEDDVIGEIKDGEQFSATDDSYEKHLCSGVQGMIFSQCGNTNDQNCHDHKDIEQLTSWQYSANGYFQYPYWYSPEYAQYSYYSGYYYQQPYQQSFPGYTPPEM